MSHPAQDGFPETLYRLLPGLHTPLRSHLVSEVFSPVSDVHGCPGRYVPPPEGSGGGYVRIPNGEDGALVQIEGKARSHSQVEEELVQAVPFWRASMRQDADVVGKGRVSGVGLGRVWNLPKEGLQGKDEEKGAERTALANSTMDSKSWPVLPCHREDTDLVGIKCANRV